MAKQTPPPEPPLPAPPSPDTRQRLLEAALLTFAEQGFDRATIREIARRAKANSALVQYYFGGKEGLHREALRMVLESGRLRHDALPPAPEPGSGDRALALAAFRGHLAAFAEHALECHCGGAPMEQDLHQAAMQLWSREMQNPMPHMVELVMETVRPFKEHMEACLRILRPDLQDEERFLMSVSIHGQILYLLSNLSLINLLKGRDLEMDDLPALVTHLVAFNLRGLGVPEANDPQGA